LSEHIILIGTYGWEHPEWDLQFYPEDLPKEWKIGYFGNEYPVVMIPQSYWGRAIEVYQQWLEESDDGLLFLCEWPSSGAEEHVYQQARAGILAVSERVMGVIVPITAMPTDQEWQHISELAASNGLSFELLPELRTAFEREINHRLPELDYGLCWHADEIDKEDIKRGPITVCRTENDFEPKELRVLIETLIAVSKGGDGKRKTAFIVEGSPPPLKLLTNAGIILDLL